MKDNIWEEKNLIEPLKNCENNPILGPSDITNETKMNVTANRWKDTGEEKKWIKNCPKCNKEQIYSCKSSYINSIKKNSVCGKCISNLRKIVVPVGGWKRVCKNCWKEMKYSCKKSFVLCEKNNGLCRSCAVSKSSKTKNMSVFRTDEYRKKQSEMMLKARKTESYGSEFREKLRKRRINNFRKNGKMANFNPIACKFIDELNNRKGWNLKHALNGGEIELFGYFPDGYDIDKNIVFEYDEPKHDSNYHKIRDLKRQNDIIKKVNPFMFIRYNQTSNKIIDVITNKEII